MKAKTKKYKDIASEDKARLISAWLDEKQAGNLKALDVRGISQVTDVILLATARTGRHAQALADHVLDMSGTEEIEYLGMEGYKGGEWVLMDMNDVVVHIFQDDVRAFYNLEGLWAEGLPLDLGLETGPDRERGPDDDFGPGPEDDADEDMGDGA